MHVEPSHTEIVPVFPVLAITDARLAKPLCCSETKR